VNIFGGKKRKENREALIRKAEQPNSLIQLGRKEVMFTRLSAGFFLREPIKGEPLSDSFRRILTDTRVGVAWEHDGQIVRIKNEKICLGNPMARNKIRRGKPPEDRTGRNQRV
jgi:hypothetical protein